MLGWLVDAIGRYSTFEVEDLDGCVQEEEEDSDTSMVEELRVVERERVWVQDRVLEAKAAATALASTHRLASVSFTEYGRSTVKRWGVSPDAWAQLALQLAWDRIMCGRRCVAVYEPAHTRAFQGGRTETIRAVSQASVEWVGVMRGPVVADPSVAWAFLRRAASEHSARTHRASAGLGVDRHLFGLRQVLAAVSHATAGQEVPGDFPEARELLAHPLVARSSRWVVSTSNISAPPVMNWGWGEVESDGVGVAYSVLDSGFQFNIVARADVAPVAHLAMPTCDGAGFGANPPRSTTDSPGLPRILANALKDALADMRAIVPK